jgi:uncharacterized protein
MACRHEPDLTPELTAVMSLFIRSSIASLSLVAAAAVCAQGAAPAAGVPLMKPPLPAQAPSTSAPATPFKTISWDALAPANWDPMKDFRGADFSGMSDGDPRTTELMAQMRKSWDNAPVNTALVGQAVRIPGFVVPLEDGKDGLKEFLLVPYFGACIHSPPPPSNQVIHVLPKSPAKGYRSMDTVWISGTLTSVQTDSFMGAASWRMEAITVTPYAEARR